MSDAQPLLQDHPQPLLTTVNLFGCSGITGVGIQWLCEGCPAVLHLNVKGTKVKYTIINVDSHMYVSVNTATLPHLNVKGIEVGKLADS